MPPAVARSADRVNCLRLLCMRLIWGLLGRLNRKRLSGSHGSGAIKLGRRID